jgi:hypothetical protein
MTKEERKAYMKKWREEHKEHLKQYREAHKEEIRIYSKTYYMRHQDEVDARNRKWRQDNREKWNAYCRERYHERKQMLAREAVERNG